jgi:hypothetical protein
MSLLLETHNDTNRAQLLDCGPHFHSRHKSDEVKESATKLDS